MSAIKTFLSGLPAWTTMLWHGHILVYLLNPNHDILLLLAGILLLYLEANRPGRVVPGCLGLLAASLALYGLSHFPVRESALVTLFLGVVLLALSARYSLLGVTALAGTVCVMNGLWKLVLTPAIRPAVAVSSAVIFGVTTAWLARIAYLARRNKIHSGFPTMPPSPAKPDPAE